MQWTFGSSSFSCNTKDDWFLAILWKCSSYWSAWKYLTVWRRPSTKSGWVSGDVRALDGEILPSWPHSWLETPMLLRTNDEGQVKFFRSLQPPQAFHWSSASCHRVIGHQPFHMETTSWHAEPVQDLPRPPGNLMVTTGFQSIAQEWMHDQNILVSGLHKVQFCYW